MSPSFLADLCCPAKLGKNLSSGDVLLCIREHGYYIGIGLDCAILNSPQNGAPYFHGAWCLPRFDVFSVQARHSPQEARSRSPAFDVKLFLDSAGLGRAAAKFEAQETVFSQGDPSCEDKAGLPERVSDPFAPHTLERSESVHRGSLSVHNVLNADPAHNKCIRDKRAVATPCDRFCAHQCALLLPG
jgi:hypothetical protein